MRRSLACCGGLPLALVLIVGCSSGSSGSGGGGPTASAALFGFAFKGVVANAALTVYALKANGVRGEELAQGTTDAQGGFQIPNIPFTGWVLLAITGGLATDFLGNSAPIDPAFPIYGFAKLLAGSPILFTATFLTTMMFYLLQAELLNGGVTLERGILNAERRLALLFGLGAFLSLLPINLAIQTSVPPGDGATYGAAMHGFCELAINIGIAEMVLAHLMGRDLMDGRLDGQFYGQTLQDGATVLPATIWSVLFGVAITNFMLSSFNVSGLLPADITAIVALAAMGLFLVQAPRLFSIYSRALREDQDNDVELKLDNAPQNPEVEVGGQVLAPGNVTRTDSKTLQVTVPAATVQQTNVNANGKIAVTVTDTDTGLAAEALEGFAKLLVSLPPVVDASTLSPECAASGGGTQIELSGDNFGPGTTARIRNATEDESAVVTADGPHKIKICVPPLPAGTYDIVVQNPGSTETVLSGALEVKAKNLNQDATETDNAPQWSAAVKLAFDPSGDRTITALSFTDAYTNADSGTSSVVRHTIGTASPTLQTDTLSTDIIRSRCGEQESVLYFNTSGFNFFTKRFVMEDLRSGLGPNGIFFGWKIPTGVTRATIAGQHWVSLQQWGDFSGDGWRRHMFGIVDIGADGTATYSLFCVEVNLTTGETSIDVLTQTFTVDVTDDGHLTGAPIVPLPGIPNIRGWTNGLGDVGIFFVEDTDSFGYGMTLRRDEDADLADFYGVLGGQFMREEVEINGVAVNRANVSLERGVYSLEGAVSPYLRFFEESEASTDSAEIDFDWKVDVGAYALSLSGAYVHADTGLAAGALYSEGKRTIALHHDVLGTTGEWGMQVGLPMWQTNHSLRDDYHFAQSHSRAAGDGTSAETGISIIGNSLYLNLAAPTIDGHRHEQAGSKSLLSSVGQRVTRDILRDVTVDPVTGVGGEIPTSYVIAHRRLIVFATGPAPPGHPLEGETPPFVKLTGNLAPDANAFIAADTGRGTFAGRKIGFKRAASGITLGGDYSLSTFGRFFDGTQGGDLKNAVGRGSITYASGSASASGSTFEEVENNTSTLTSFSFGGTTSLGTDGLTDWSRSDGKTVVLMPTPDGKAFVGLVLSGDGDHTLWFGTQATTSAPAVNNAATLRFGSFFDDFSVFPPRNNESVGLLKHFPLGPGQVNLTGVAAVRHNYATVPTLFQFFQLRTDTAGATGDATIDEGGIIYRGGLSDNGVGHATQGDADPDAITVELKIDF
ncbi:MAG: IPT/TIG domain-containing protein [Planctomycetota bacterium]